MFLGKVTGPSRLGPVIEVVWVVFFILACRMVFHYGTRRYSGYGG